MKKSLPGISGFTLMELLISITILSVVVLLIMSALRVSTNAWEKGEENIESEQRFRAVVEMMVGQMEMIRTDRAYKGEGETYYLKGDPRTLSFVTTETAVYEATPQPVHTTYSIITEDSRSKLILVERKVPLLPPLPENIEPDDEEGTIALLSDFFDIRFEFLKDINDEEGMLWQEKWDPAVENGLPLAVRIVMQEDETDSPVRAIVRFVRNPSETVNYKWNVN